MINRPVMNNAEKDYWGCRDEFVMSRISSQSIMSEVSLLVYILHERFAIME